MRRDHKQPWEITAFEYRWGEDVHDIRAQLSQAGREFMDAAIASKALTAIDASATMREDRTLLTRLGFSWTTDRHRVPMGKVSQNKRAEIVRRNVHHKRYIKQALTKGKIVPFEVLNDYPAELKGDKL